VASQALVWGFCSLGPVSSGMLVARVRSPPPPSWSGTAMPSTATPRAPGWLMWWSGSGPKASRSVAARLSRALRAGIPRTIPGS